MKRGLRDATGRGVLTSLTRISEVKGCTVDGQDTIPCPGVLYYRGYDALQGEMFYRALLKAYNDYCSQ